MIARMAATLCLLGAALPWRLSMRRTFFRQLRALRLARPWWVPADGGSGAAMATMARPMSWRG